MPRRAPSQTGPNGAEPLYVKAQNGWRICSSPGVNAKFPPDRCRFERAHDALATEGRTSAVQLERKAVKAPSLLVACGLVLFSTLLMRASTADVSPAAPSPHSGTESGLQALALRRRALRRGRARLPRVLRPAGWMAWAETGAPAPTVTWRRTTSSSRPPMPRRGSRLLQRRRQRHPDADDPLFRPIDADDFRTNGENASDFSNLRQNGSSGSPSRCRRTSGSSIP